MNNKERMKRREMRRILYAMRRQWGVPAAYYSVDPGDLDLDTGMVTSNKVKYDIPQFLTWIVGEEQVMERRLRMGAIFQTGVRLGIIDAMYLPSGYTPKNTDYIVYNNIKYEFEKWDILDGQSGFIIQMRHSQGTLPEQIIERTIRHALPITQDVLWQLS